MKNEEFHIPFVKNLAFICLVTIVSMVSVHYFLKNMLVSPLNSPNFSSHKSYSEAKAEE